MNNNELETWEEAKAAAAEARAKERALRNKVIDCSPKLKRPGHQTTYENLPDGRVLCATKSYNYKIKAPEHEFYKFIDTLDREHRRVLKITYSIDKAVLRDLPDSIREQVESYLIKSQGLTQLGYLPPPKTR